MGTAIQTVLGLFAIFLMFAPACILTYVAIRVHRLLGRTGAILISVGAILLTIASLDFLFSFIVALLFGAPELARFSIVSLYVFKALNYLALLAIGFGLLISAKQFNAKVHGPAK